MPSLPRVHAFEFNDLSWIPASLRDSIVESLSRALRWGGMLRGLVAPFAEFMARSGADEVLDLCAGAAGPALVLVAEMAATGTPPPRFVLTDLYPRLDAWAAARVAHPDVISFVPEPVDATAIPPALASGRARVIINAFHHFPEPLARAILADAVGGSAGIFISESFDRNPLRFLSFAPAGLSALFANPLLSPRRSLAKVLLTWLTPAALAASVWDGLVSTLRVYNEAELRSFVAPLGDHFRWEYRTYEYPLWGRGYCFFGTPIRRGTAPGAIFDLDPE